jgi:hypothetical protein
MRLHVVLMDKIGLRASKPSQFPPTGTKRFPDNHQDMVNAFAGRPVDISIRRMDEEFSIIFQEIREYI